MNIVLSDIRMLTLEPAASTANSGMAPRESGGLITDKFPGKIDFDIQIVDFKELITGLSNPTESGLSDQLDDNNAKKASNEFFLTQPPKVSIERDVAIAALPFNVEAVVLNPAAHPVNEDIALSAVKRIGESLPAGGESLPLDLANPETAVLLQQSAINIPVEVSQHQLKAAPIIALKTPALDSLSGETVAADVATAVVPGIATKVFPAVVPVSLESTVVASTPVISDVGPVAASLAATQTPTDLAKARQKIMSQDFAPTSAAIGGARSESDARYLSASRLNPATEGQVIARNPDFESLVADSNKPKPVTTEAMARMLDANPNNAIAKTVMTESDPNGTSLFELPVSQVNPSNQSSLNQLTSPVVANLDAHALVSLKPPGTALPLPAAMQTMTPTNVNSSAEWANGIGERVSWMINQNSNSATIRLDPPSLGQLEIQIKLADDSTLVTIHTQQSQTRELLDAASHRLRELLQENGYQNVSVDVSQRQEQQAGKQMQSDNPDEQAGNTLSDGETGIDEKRSIRQFSSDSIVDTFA
ncbi:MAG: type III secretion system needle length determinant [Planctomycetota bacterium]|jgi:type III secretion system needle length determinant